MNVDAAIQRVIDELEFVYERLDNPEDRQSLLKALDEAIVNMRAEDTFFVE